MKIMKSKKLLGGLLALVSGAAIAVLFVFPAELGWDPTGVGAATGLVELSQPQANAERERGKKRRGVLVEHSQPLEPLSGASDVWVIELEPFKGIELKYEVPDGGVIHFDWQASKPLNYDLHAHPFDGGEELTESYAIEKASQQYGRYSAPFSGIHGWHWQNRHFEVVSLTVRASGNIVASTVFSDRGSFDRPLTPAGR